MSNYNTDNMVRFLGSESNDTEASKLATHLINHGWTLEIPEGEKEYHAYVEECGEWREMSESEWQEALAECFN